MCLAASPDHAVEQSDYRCDQTRTARKQVRESRPTQSPHSSKVRGQTPLRSWAMSCQSPPRISDIQSIEAIEFRQAMRNLASGVSIVATGTAVRRRGLTVSSITSICMEPPCLLVCINASSETHDAILANGTFWRESSRRQSAGPRTAFRRPAWRKRCPSFDTAPWDQGVLDVPVLQSAVCVLECVLHHHQLVGTHGDLYRPDCRDAISSRQSTHQLPWRTSNVTVRLSAGFHRNVAIRNDTLRLRLC